MPLISMRISKYAAKNRYMIISLVRRFVSNDFFRILFQLQPLVIFDNTRDKVKTITIKPITDYLIHSDNSLPYNLLVT